MRLDIHGLRTRSSRRAFTLLEVALVLSIGGALLLFAGLVTVGAVRLGRTSLDHLDTLSIQADLADHFRADVTAASTAPERAAQFKAGPHCLVLEGSDDRTIVYEWINNELRRYVIDKTGPKEQPVSLGPAPGTVEFLRSEPSGRLITLRLTEVRKHGPGQVVEISASLRGGRS